MTPRVRRLEGSSPRVWILNQYALPRGATGITRHGDLASVLVAEGFDITVFASSFDNFTRKAETERRGAAFEEERNGVKFVWIRTRAYASNDARRLKSMVDYYWRVVRAGLARGRDRPDVVIGSSPHLLSALAGAQLAGRFRAKYVLELRDVWPEDLVDLGALRDGSIVHQALVRLATWLERRADLVVTVPPKLQRHLAARGIPTCRLLHIPNGVFFPSDEEPVLERPFDGGAGESDVGVPSTLRELFDGAPRSFVVMYMGAHGVANDLGNLLEAADYLKRHHPEERVKFVLVGGGQQRDQLMAETRKRGLTTVHFHPPVPKSAVRAVAASADALLVHLHAAGSFDRFGRSPNKLYDYLAAAKPVLFSTRDSETILDRVGAGFTFEPGSPRALAEAVLRVMHLPEHERRMMGQRGRQAVRQGHDLERLGRALGEALRTLTYGADARSEEKLDSEAPRSGALPE